MTNKPSRANRWTLTRRLADRLVPQVVPGRHHTIWEAR